MAHLSRIASMSIRADVRKAAVLVLLFEKASTWHVVLIRRKSIQGDVHAGQISFPGGRAMRNESLKETALRESFEEIGSPVESITTLGQLTSLHIPVSNHLVYPIVAYLHQYSGWHAQESEVELILEVPIDIFLKHETRVLAHIPLMDGQILPEVPCYNVNGHLIWGATAMMLSEFTEVLRDAEVGRK